MGARPCPACVHVRAGLSIPDWGELMELTGNLAPLQWLARRMGFRLVPLAEQQQERGAPWARSA